MTASSRSRWRTGQASISVGTGSAINQNRSQNQKIRRLLGDEGTANAHNAQPCSWILGDRSVYFASHLNWAIGEQFVPLIVHTQVPRPVPRTIYRAQRICVFPVELINQTLETELSPGDAWLSQMAHQHFAQDHPNDYDICFPLLDEIIATPGWVGQAPKHHRNIELVTRVSPSVGIVLSAVSLEINRFGNYNICSVYRIDQEDLDSRRRANRIWPIIKKPPL